MKKLENLKHNLSFLSDSIFLEKQKIKRIGEAAKGNKYGNRKL